MVYEIHSIYPIILKVDKSFNMHNFYLHVGVNIQLFC